MPTRLKSTPPFNSLAGHGAKDARQAQQTSCASPLSDRMAKRGIRKEIQLLILSLMLVATLFPEVAAAQWVQIGQDIDGEEWGDSSGKSVSLSADGSRMAVGAPNNGNLSGHVRVFEWNGAMWVQLGSDIGGEAPSEVSGFSVSLSADGSRVAIGSPGYLNSTGKVRVFSWQSPNWVPLGQDIHGEFTEEKCGMSISLSGDGSRLAVGSPYGSSNECTHNHTGIVRVYSWVSPNWVQRGLDICGDLVEDEAGSSVSLCGDGSRVAFGAPGNDENGPGSGHARVFQYNGYPIFDWLPVGENICGQAVGDYSGWAVSLSADGLRLAIGAHFAGLDNQGQVRVFSWQSSDWFQLGEDIDGVAAGDLFGFAVALSSDGSRLAAGSPFHTGTDPLDGQVGVYQYKGFPVHRWLKVGQYIEGEAQGDSSGYSVALSSNGSRVAIGATGNDDSGDDAGHVRVFAEEEIFADGFESGDTSAWS